MTRLTALSLLTLLVACGGSDAEPAADVAPDVPADVAADVVPDVAPDTSPPDVPGDATPDVQPDTPEPDAAQDVPSQPDVAEPDATEDVTPDTVDPDATADSEEPDATEDVPPQPDAAADVAEDADATEDVPGPAEGTVVVTPEAPGDAVTSYLMDAAQSAWSAFHGATVHLGRHWDEGSVSYHTMLRFPGVQVPVGATVTSATLSFHATNVVDSANPLWINVYAVAEADAAAWEPGQYEVGRPDQRGKTDAFIDHWLVRCNDDCTDLTEYDCEQRKLDCWDREVRYACPKDLSALVQEVVDQEGWQPGNAMALLLVNAATDQDGADYTKSRSITGVDPERGPAYRPRLEITFE